MGGCSDLCRKSNVHIFVYYVLKGDDQIFAGIVMYMNLFIMFSMELFRSLQE